MIIIKLSELSKGLIRITSKLICPDCHGDGTIPTNEFKGHSIGYEHSYLICLRCNGKGIIKLKIEEIR
jgi:DnaJ-class molecular chaperone